MYHNQLPNYPLCFSQCCLKFYLVYSHINFIRLPSTCQSLQLNALTSLQYTPPPPLTSPSANLQLPPPFGSVQHAANRISSVMRCDATQRDIPSVSMSLSRCRTVELSLSPSVSLSAKLLASASASTSRAAAELLLI